MLPTLTPAERGVLLPCTKAGVRAQMARQRDGACCSVRFQSLLGPGPSRSGLQGSSCRGPGPGCASARVCKGPWDKGNQCQGLPSA